MRWPGAFLTLYSSGEEGGPQQFCWEEDGLLCLYFNANFLI